MWGTVPNVLAIMAEEPELPATYWAADTAFRAASLEPVEQAVVLLAAARARGCRYCTAGHGGAAVRAGVSMEDVEALRAGEDPDDPRLRALSRFTAHLVNPSRDGDDRAIEDFLSAGFREQDALALVLGIALKTMTAPTNRIGKTPLDPELEEWAVR
jgi:AhpD family alkylhydroperoxidase